MDYHGLGDDAEHEPPALEEAGFVNTVKPEYKPEYQETEHIQNRAEQAEVNHKLFGDGIIVGIEGNILSIAFKEGIKKVVKNHPTLTKI